MKTIILDRFNTCCLLVCVLVMILAVVSVSADTKPVIRFLSKAALSDENVHLGSIAQIQCDDSALKKRLEQLVVGRSPLSGQSAYIQADQVSARLKQYGLGPDQVRILATGPIKVTRVYNELSSERIRAAVRTFINAHAPWSQEQLKIRSIRCNQDVRLPPGTVALKVSAPKHSDWLGSIPFSVHISVNGQTVKKITVPTNIEVWSDVVVAAKPLGRNQPVDSSDVRIENMNLARVPADAVFDAKQVVGRRTNRAIAVNSILCSNQVELPPAVRRGDVVQLLAESGNLKISTRGIAKENGNRGERIRITNLRSNKIVYAQIIDARTARVDF